MATFLSNLPSFDKNNFSNFQPDLNRFQQPRKQAFNSCNKEYPNEQVIVNQRCNLIIQYLEKQSNEYRFQQLILSNEKAKKREIDDVMKDVAGPSSNTSNVSQAATSSSKLENDGAYNRNTHHNISSNSFKYVKKRRLEQNNPKISSNATINVNNSNNNNDMDEYIDVDDDDDDEDEDDSNEANNNLIDL